MRKKYKYISIETLKSYKIKKYIFTTLNKKTYVCISMKYIYIKTNERLNEFLDKLIKLF